MDATRERVGETYGPSFDSSVSIRESPVARPPPISDSPPMRACKLCGLLVPCDCYHRTTFAPASVPGASVLLSQRRTHSGSVLYTGPYPSVSSRPHAAYPRALQDSSVNSPSIRPRHPCPVFGISHSSTQCVGTIRYRRRYGRKWGRLDSRVLQPGRDRKILVHK